MIIIPLEEKMKLMKTLSDYIHSEETLVVPDAYDAISARIIQCAGFKAVQCSGYSMSLSMLYKEEKFVSIDENLSRTREIVSAVNIPVMADGEDGYAQDDLFEHNLRRFINTGIAGINIEDQNLWNPRRKEIIVSAEELLNKIKTVLSLKTQLKIPHFLLNARTDALKTTDNRTAALNLAIERANLYLAAGADMAFIPYVKTRDEVRLLKNEVNGPLSIAAGLPYNIKEFSVNDCRDIGIARVSLPSLMILTNFKSLVSAAASISQSETFDSIISEESMLDQSTLSSILNGSIIT